MNIASVKLPQNCQAIHTPRTAPYLGTTLLAILIIATLLLISPRAHAVIGGERTSKPWVVRVLTVTGDQIDAACTGAALSADIVITAAHCHSDEVHFADGSVEVDYQRSIPGLDVKLLILSRAHPLTEYAELGQNFLANNLVYSPGAVGTVYGYGITKDGDQKSLEVRLEFQGRVREWPEAFLVAPQNGEVEKGDSGGPLMIDGKLVGVLKKATRDPNDGHFIALYHGISAVHSALHEMQHHREFRDVAVDNATLPWISNVKIENAGLWVTMSDELLNNRHIYVWANGRYLASIENNHAYYAYRYGLNGGTKFRMEGLNVRDTDIIQIGINTGGGSSNPKASQLLYETPATGIQAVKIENGALAITMGADLINSGHQIIVWLNGKYHGEVQGEKYYYATRQNVTGGALFRMGGNPVKYGDLVQIGIVTGTNSPSAAVLLYTGRPSGIDSVTVDKGSAHISLSNSLINSGQRVIVWVNGSYAGEVFNGSIYNCWLAGTSSSGKTIIPYVASAANSLLQIGVVPGSPGQAYGTPDKAKLLYSDVLE